MLLRREAIAIILDCLTDHELVILANGFISREGFHHRDVPQHFYMLGSMGLGAAIGLGVVLSLPDTEVAVLDGDGNVLMGLGILPMVGAWQPTHFLHVVLDNGCYGSTGGQPTVASAVDFPALALASGYTHATSVETTAAIQAQVQKWFSQSGPMFLHVRISDIEPGGSSRVQYDPPDIAQRFASATKVRMP
jgi:sulfopyruvate decarboxylase subunit beta